MGCEFSIPITLSTAEVVASASVAINNEGGTFTATDNEGTFTAPVLFGIIV
jgi:hydroxymethylglutaryl-CoA reductase